MITATTGVGTIASAHSSVLSTSQKLNELVGKPIFSTYVFMTSGLDSNGNQRLRLPSSVMAARMEA